MTTREKEMFKASAEYCNTTEPLLTKSAEYSFIRGAQWSDENPNWIKTEDELPPEGIEVIAFHHKWIDEDFNPNGTRIGFLNGKGFINYTSQCLIYNGNTGRADSWVPSISDIFADDWEIVE